MGQQPVPEEDIVMGVDVVTQYSSAETVQFGSPTTFIIVGGESSTKNVSLSYTTFPKISIAIISR
jgi:hypothetical protein